MPRNEWDDHRNARGGQNTVTVGISSTLLVPGNPRRMVCMISPNKDTNFWIAFRRAASATDGFLIPMQGMPIRLSRWEHGDLVTGPIFAIAQSALKVTFFDTLMQD